MRANSACRGGVIARRPRLAPGAGMDLDHRRADVAAASICAGSARDEQRDANAGGRSSRTTGASALALAARHRGRPRWCAPAAARARGRRRAAASCSAISTISRVAAISRFSGLVMLAPSAARYRRRRMWRRSSRRCAVMPSAPAAMAISRRLHRIGMPAAARIADGRDVVDVDAEADGTDSSEHECVQPADPLSVHPLGLRPPLSSPAIAR